MSELVRTKIEPSSLHDFLRWVHCELPADELSIIKAEVIQRQQLAASPEPQQILSGGLRLAGTYFTCLPGRLAMLGAVRTLAHCEHLGSLLLQDLARVLFEQYSAIQIQAAVNERDHSALKMLEDANFRHLTDVDQMWLDTNQVLTADIDLGTHPPTRPTHLERPTRHELAIEWAPAASITQASFVEMMESTFLGSLDCPELNGLRKSHDVLASFLLGREFQEVTTWEVAYVQGELIGCLLMADHPNSMSELVYMGLVPAARRRGLGRQLVLRAAERAQRLNQHGVVLAVDTRNSPAIRAYQDCGFRGHCRLKVFVAPVSSQ